MPRSHSMRQRRSIGYWSVFLPLLANCGSSGESTNFPEDAAAIPEDAAANTEDAADADSGPVQDDLVHYTEIRSPCAERHPFRKAYFGDLHVHTAYSFD